MIGIFDLVETKREKTMSLLDGIKKPDDRPVIATITGEAGLGKTSLAATFEKPIFIRAEDGLQAIPHDIRPAAFPKLTTEKMLFEQLTALIKEDHEYKTLVIDSVTQLELLFTTEIIAADPKKPKSINQALGGYGAGLSAVAARHARVRKAAEYLNEKGMNVVFIAHSDVSTIELPDQDPYNRYDLRLSKKSMPHYVDNVDLVAYLKLETFVNSSDDSSKAKAVSTSNRIAVCHPSACNVSKNRFGIEQELPVKAGVNPFIGLIPTIK